MRTVFRCACFPPDVAPFWHNSALLSCSVLSLCHFSTDTLHIRITHSICCLEASVLITKTPTIDLPDSCSAFMGIKPLSVWSIQSCNRLWVTEAVGFSCNFAEWLRGNAPAKPHRWRGTWCCPLNEFSENVSDSSWRHFASHGEFHRNRARHCCWTYQHIRMIFILFPEVMHVCVLVLSLPKHVCGPALNSRSLPLASHNCFTSKHVLLFCDLVFSLSAIVCSVQTQRFQHIL